MPRGPVPEHAAPGLAVAMAGSRARVAGGPGAASAGRRVGEPWPRSVTLAIELAVFALLLAAVVYGPSYYQCRQAKERGFFFVGTTVETCFRERLSAQNKAVDAFVQALRDRF